MLSTGPKISSWRARSALFECKMTVGPTQLPLAWSLAQLRPSSKILAPPASASSMYERMRFCEASSMTGPIWPPFWPALSSLALATTASSSAGCSPTVSKTEAAMQRWPAQPAKEDVMSAAAIAVSQSGSATRWFLAPPSASTFLLRLWQRLYTISATLLEPTKVRAEMSGWSHRLSTTSTVPWTSWNTPSGTPACFMSSATRVMVIGHFSEGLRMTQLPMVSAMGTVHIGTMMGKLKGTTQPTMPTGSSWS
mmetsp:Transcript_25771/g.72987  ORF Transcript_25771/g.72987 Transcript_25771/m.72987 type:complete len:252 (-) Transcript_25771:525-1280(-)